MKCILCSHRKGKRFCPAKNTQICAQCCGQKRVLEIDCPSDCVYLTEGQAYQSVKKYVAQLQREEDPVRRRKLYETHHRLGAVLSKVEEKIVDYAANLRSLDDQLILEAVTLVLKTYQTEQNGVIYEHTSTNPLAQSLVRELRELLEHLRTDRESGFSGLRGSDLLDCLGAVEADVRFHAEGDSAIENYLTFIRRNHPEATGKGSGEGPLIEI